MSNPSDNNSSKSTATIGASIRIKGEVTGSEDLIICGTVEGSVSLKENVVTVGEDAKVQANIAARIIRVEGEVAGDLTGAEKVVVASTGQVRGNITSPCLSLEEGARLKGSIDTDPAGPLGDRVSVTVEEAKAKKEKAPRITAAVSETNGAGFDRSNY